MTSKQEAEHTQTATEEEQATETETVAAKDQGQVETEGEVADNTTPNEPDLATQLEEALAKAEANRDLAIRAKAELENLRKRHDRDLSNAHKYALERFVKELLPVCDSLELGLKAAQDESADIAKVAEGTELTLNLFTSVMEKFNVAVVDPEGEPFNPELHQAMAMQPTEDIAPNMVLTVVQKGYSLNGRLVRPAMVIVSQAAPTKIDEQA